MSTHAHAHSAVVGPSLLEQFRSLQLLRDYPLWIEENIEPFVPGAKATMKAWLAAMALDTSLQALHDCHAAVQGADMAEELRAAARP